MNRKLIGNIGETKALLYFVERGYQVYLPFQDNSELDMIVDIEGQIKKVSVKSTSQKSGNGYIVELRNVSRRKNNIVVIKEFDKSKVDLLVVFIQPLDKIVIINAEEIKNKSSLVVS